MTDAIITRVKRTSQPQTPVGIDWGNPAAKGIDIFLPDVGQKSIVGTADVTKGGSPVRTVAAYGRGWQFTSGSDFFNTTNWPVLADGTQYTYLVVYAQTAVGSLDFLVNGDNANRAFQIRVETSGAPSYIAFNTIVGTQNPIGSVAAVGTVQTIICRQAATTAAIFQNGVLKDSRTTSGTIKGQSASDIAIGNRTTNYLHGSIGLVVRWPRALSDAEAQSVSANPWQLFAPLSRTIWVPAAAGGGDISATASITLADVTSSATGTLPITAALAKTLDAVTTSATGTLPISGAAAITLGDLTSSATGTSANTATLSKTLDDVTTSATGTLPIVAASSVTLDALTTSATGTLPLAAASSVTLDDVTTVATGTQGGNSGTASITLDALTTTATGTLPIAAAAGITLDAATVASASTLALTGTQSTTLADVTLTATGAVGSFLYGQADITLGNVTLTSAGTLPLAGAAAVTLAALSVSAASTMLIKGSASITLANLTIYATSGDIVDRLFTSDIAVLTVPIIYFPLTQPVNYVATDINTDLFVVQ